MNNEEMLKQLKEDIASSLSDNSKDFISDYSLENIHYLSDYFHEYADGNVSIYYNEQRNYYYEHSEECDDALLNYGYDLAKEIKERGLDGLICFAGMLGEYEEIYAELSNEVEDILKSLVIDYLLSREDCDLISVKQLNEILQEIDYNEDNAESVKDEIDEILSDEEI